MVNLKIGGFRIESREFEEETPWNLNEIEIDGSHIYEFLWMIPDDPANHTVKVALDCLDDRDSPNCRQTFYLVTVRPYHDDNGKEVTTSNKEVLQYSVVSLLVGLSLGLGYHYYQGTRESGPVGQCSHRGGPAVHETCHYCGHDRLRVLAL